MYYYSDLQKVTTQRSFLQLFKTISCSNNTPHDLDQCSNYHGDQDIRKCPYSPKNQIVYCGQMCNNTNPHDWKVCNFSHNYYELFFHPLRYKTQICNRFYDCQKIFCPYNHNNSVITSQFFRFDINTFKVFKCNNQCNKIIKIVQHDKKICLFYHNSKDRRRKDFEAYQHVQCSLFNCKTADNCQYSHNKIQQLFHPSRYKSKFCEKILKDQHCEYGQFCSFAHNNHQITIKLIEYMPRNTDFQIFQYKTIWCPLTIDHNRSQCVYAHNIQDFRRDPRVYNYLPIKCFSWKTNDKIKSLEEAGCEAGMQCKYCHGWKQFEHHPQNYMKKRQPRKGSGQDQQIIKMKLGKQESINGVKCKWDAIINKHLNPTKTKNILYTNGVPFFKCKQTNSHGSKTTKAKSQKQHYSNQQNKFSQLEERGSTSNIQIDLRNQKYQTSSLITGQDQSYHYQIFRLKDTQTFERTSCKSCDKKQDYPIHYSDEIHKIIDYSTIEKLKKARINQIKLLNFKQQQIYNLTCLTPNQKYRLSQKIKAFNDGKAQKFIKYSSTLQKIFKMHKYEHLLEKMMNKKVQQQKLINLSQKQIIDLSFLAQNEKNDLPKILQQIANQRQFSLLDKEIKTSIL